MFISSKYRQLALTLAVLVVSMAVGGCSATTALVLPDPLTTAQTTSTPLITGGDSPISLFGSTTTTSTVSTTGQSPILRFLTLTNTYANATVGGCAKPGSLAVPDITNIPLGQAQSTLLLLSLKPGNIRWAYSGTAPAGNVISQDPAAGKLVQSGAAVNLLCSLGPQMAAMPDVTGRALTDAQMAISAAGFTVGATQQSYSTTVAAGTVISQDPTAGTLEVPGAAVNLLVSQGPQPVAVPDVTGRTQAEAETAITAAGLSIGSMAQGSSETVPSGQVMSQNPAAGSMVLPGAPVDLTVSQGPQPVPVPNIVGRTQADAQAAITGAGFSVGAVTQAWSATVPTGSVISQDPAAGTVMIPGTAVSIVVSKGPEPVPVPNVTGMAQSDAQAAITAAALTVGTVTQDYSDTVAEGSVISQNPAGGASLAPGASVNLVIATKTLSLCDYYPFAVGNKWATNGSSGKSSEVTDAFTINGCPCWKIMVIDHAANDKVTYTYVAQANGWMYNYTVLDDLYLLPGIAASAQKVAPLSFRPGESFTTAFGGNSFTVTPAKGKLSDFVSDTSACPFGDVQDTVALKLGSFTVLVFGRDLGPLYFNYLTSSGFDTSITIVGGCGAGH